MNNSLAAALSERDRYIEAYTAYTEALRSRSDKSMLELYAKEREIDISSVEQAGIFYIGSMAEMMLPDYVSELKDFGLISPTNGKPIFSERFVMPIPDTDGRVLNLVGYKKDAAERYIYGTARYYMRRDTLYGLDNLLLAYNMGYAILTEGITDCQRLRSLDYPNSFAMCGTHGSDYITSQLKRCKYGVIKVPDRDTAGLRAERKWSYPRSITLYVKRGFKDADAMLRTEAMCSLFKEYMSFVIAELTSSALPMHKETTVI